MTRYEYMKNVGLEKLSGFLCDMIDQLDLPDNVLNCEICPAQENCVCGHNGFMEWLKQETKTDDRD